VKADREQPAKTKKRRRNPMKTKTYLKAGMRKAGGDAK